MVYLENDAEVQETAITRVIMNRTCDKDGRQHLVTRSSPAAAMEKFVYCVVLAS